MKLSVNVHRIADLPPRMPSSTYFEEAVLRKYPVSCLLSTLLTLLKLQLRSRIHETSQVGLSGLNLMTLRVVRSEPSFSNCSALLHKARTRKSFVKTLPKHEKLGPLI